MNRQDLMNALAEYAQKTHEIHEAEHGPQSKTKAAKDAAATLWAESRKLEEVMWRMTQCAIADELRRQSEYFWDTAAMYQHTKELFDTNGEETASMVTDATVKVCRDVAKRFKARAAELNGDDAATLGLLDTPAPTPGGDGDGS